jgi:hypothetical protein
MLSWGSSFAERTQRNELAFTLLCALEVNPGDAEPSCPFEILWHVVDECRQLWGQSKSFEKQLIDRRLWLDRADPT